MKNSTVLGIVVVLLGIIGSLGYLYNTEKYKNVDLTIENTRQAREKAFVDSINTVVMNTNAELDSTNRIYKTEIAEINWEKEQIAEKLEEALANVKDMTIEFVAQYMIDNFLGDSYKLVKVNNETYIAVQVITGRDIVSRDLQFKALKRLIEQLNKEIDSERVLAKMQAKAIGTYETANDTLMTRYSAMNTDLHKSNVKVLDLTNEVDKQKGQKRIAVVVAGVLLGILIIL